MDNKYKTESLPVQLGMSCYVLIIAANSETFQSNTLSASRIACGIRALLGPLQILSSPASHPAVSVNIGI